MARWIRVNVKAKVAAAVAAIGVAAAGTVGGVALTADSPFSFASAWQNAKAGDVIVVPDGSYPAVSLTGASKAGVVTFQAEHPGLAKVASLSVSVDKVHFVGVVADGTGETRGTLTVCGSAAQCPVKFTDVVFDGFRGKSAFIRASGVTVIRSEFGGADGCKNLATEDAFRFWGGGGSPSPENDRLVDSWVHDWSGGRNGTCDGTVSPTPHLDCMQNQGGVNIEIRGNIFSGCPSDNIQMEPFSGASLGNVTVAGNYLGQTACCNSIVLGAPVAGSFCSTLHVTGNTMFKTPNLDKCAGQGVDVSGNTLCSSVAQCPVPVWQAPAPPPTTTAPTTTAPPSYSPVCATTCDEQIADLDAQLAALRGQLADSQAALADALARIARAVTDLGS